MGLSALNGALGIVIAALKKKIMIVVTMTAGMNPMIVTVEMNALNGVLAQLALAGVIIVGALNMKKNARPSVIVKDGFAITHFLEFVFGVTGSVLKATRSVKQYVQEQDVMDNTVACLEMTLAVRKPRKNATRAMKRSALGLVKLALGTKKFVTRANTALKKKLNTLIRLALMMAGFVMVITLSTGITPAIRIALTQPRLAYVAFMVARLAGASDTLIMTSLVAGKPAQP